MKGSMQSNAVQVPSFDCEGTCMTHFFGMPIVDEICPPEKELLCSYD